MDKYGNKLVIFWIEVSLLVSEYNDMSVRISDYFLWTLISESLLFVIREALYSYFKTVIYVPK
jgi:hypothetical protein